MIHTFFNDWEKILELKGFNFGNYTSQGTPEQFYVFRVFTHNVLSEEYNLQNFNAKQKILNFTIPVYSYLPKVLMCISMIYIYIYIVFCLLKKKLLSLINIIIISFFFASNFRLLILSLVDVTSFPGIEGLYMLPIYPFTYAIILFSAPDFFSKK